MDGGGTDIVVLRAVDVDAVGAGALDLSAAVVASAKFLEGSRFNTIDSPAGVSFLVAAPKRLNAGAEWD